MTPDDYRALIGEPKTWLICLAAVVALFVVFGRRDRYEPYHYDMARAQGRELPTNQTRRITFNDAIWMTTAPAAGAAAIMAWLLPAPALWLVAAVLGVVFALSAWQSMREFRAIARRDGIELRSAHGGAAGFTCVMVAFLLLCTLAVGGFFWLIW